MGPGRALGRALTERCRTVRRWRGKSIAGCDCSGFHCPACAALHTYKLARFPSRPALPLPLPLLAPGLLRGAVPLSFHVPHSTACQAMANSSSTSSRHSIRSRPEQLAVSPLPTAAPLVPGSCHSCPALMQAAALSCPSIARRARLPCRSRRPRAQQYSSGEMAAGQHISRVSGIGHRPLAGAPCSGAHASVQLLGRDFQGAELIAVVMAMGSVLK